MAIDDPTAIKFCNEKVRVAADTLSESYYTMISLVDDWNALEMSTLIPNTSETVDDGAASDGRNVIEGLDVNNIINRASELLNDYTTGSNAKLNTVLAVRVNGQPLY